MEAGSASHYTIRYMHGAYRLFCTRAGGFLLSSSQAQLRLVLSESVMEGAREHALVLEPTDKSVMPVHASWMEVSMSVCGVA